MQSGNHAMAGLKCLFLFLLFVRLIISSPAAAPWDLCVEHQRGDAGVVTGVTAAAPLLAWKLATLLPRGAMQVLQCLNLPHPVLPFPLAAFLCCGSGGCCVATSVVVLQSH